MRPGDVITQYGGRTTEVTNTDAEGRLVLADGLAYAVDKLGPDVLVDIATLTGAMKVALGQHLGGLFANNDALAGHLDAAGERSGEPVWRMPLSEEYESKLSSKIADADNAPGGPGAITAALFLQHFVGGLPWAHLDIASVGDAPKDSFEWTEGPTGFGVPGCSLESSWARTATVRGLRGGVEPRLVGARRFRSAGLRQTWRMRPGSGSRAATSSSTTLREHSAPSRRSRSSAPPADRGVRGRAVGRRASARR